MLPRRSKINSDTAVSIVAAAYTRARSLNIDPSLKNQMVLDEKKILWQTLSVFLFLNESFTTL